VPTSNVLSYQVFPYRWVILLAAAPIIATSQMFWLSFAPVATQASAFFSTTSLGISMLSMSFMLMYLLFTFPAAWIVDGFGYRRSLVLGAVITATGGILRATFAHDFAAVLVCQFIVAAGQPFLLNVLTKIPANWFPLQERAIASGVLTLVQYVGMIVPMVLSPVLVRTPDDIPHMLDVYAVLAVLATLVAIALTREHPPAPPGPKAETTAVSLRAMLGLLTKGPYLQILVLIFISLGIFNTLVTEVEAVLSPRGLTMGQADMAGAVFVLAGIAGAVVLPGISDRMRRRMPLLRVGLALLTVFYLLLTVAHGAAVITGVAALAGFTIMGLAPIVFQHSAETAYPVGEGSSFGLLFFTGQVSGALFLYGFEWAMGRTGSVLVPMLVFVVLTAIQVPLTLRMKESPILIACRQGE